MVYIYFVYFLKFYLNTIKVFFTIFLIKKMFKQKVTILKFLGRKR